MERTHDSDMDEIPKYKSLNTISAWHLFEGCLRNYKALLMALQTEDLRLTYLTTSIVPELKDEFSRLRVWGEQTYVTLIRNARYSLDEQLCEDKNIKKIVLNSLRRLNNHIERAIEQTMKCFSPVDIDPAGEECSSSSDESDTSQDVLDTASKIKLRRVVNLIFEDIRSLYRISVLLRRPQNSRRYLKSNDSTIPSHDALESMPDYGCISEKIRQWRYLSVQSNVGGDGEHVVTREGIQPRKDDEHQEVANIAFLCQRMTWANLCRRKQLDHWIGYPDVSEPRERALDDVIDFDQLESQALSAMHTLLSEIPKTALENNDYVCQTHNINDKSVAGQSNATRVPDVPVCSKTDLTFECPYCHTILDSRMMQNREAWVEHVFRDLRPYVCSFERCLDPWRLFPTRSDWINHEQQMHRRQWICSEGCAKNLMSKATMVQHLLEEHSSIIDERQVSTYADMCERPVDDAKLDTCLICSEKMSLSLLHDHVATHMEDIAFSVFSSVRIDGEDEKVVEGAAKLDTWTRKTAVAKGTNPLTFENDHGQQKTRLKFNPLTAGFLPWLFPSTEFSFAVTALALGSLSRNIQNHQTARYHDGTLQQQRRRRKEETEEEAHRIALEYKNKEEVREEG